MYYFFMESRMGIGTIMNEQESYSINEIQKHQKICIMINLINF